MALTMGDFYDITPQEDPSLRTKCESWRVNEEIGNIIGWIVIPSECEVYVRSYMLGGQYLSEAAISYASKVQLEGNRRDAWVFDIDDTVLSHVSYYSENNFGATPFNRTSWACPKAYHMECTRRKSDFFLRKGLWYCGWHVCANCSRSANVHCYMCPRVFCSGCTVEAEFLHIRKDRGLRELCYSIVYMIEHNLSINSEGFEVDFDDEETSKCLFRHYFKDLEQKTSLTWSKIDKA
ncbi:hypothetical protein L7F22_040819 [Adiantum nelumboides]|nr:hypothetical protein [Adiantum nelumboides]